jgi:large subunit ribosomal protein L13
MVAVINAEGLILGRLCTHVAKRLRNGEEIVVVNAEKAIISGRRAQILEEHKMKRRIGSQMKGPFFPRTPDQMLKRSTRNMLEWKKPSGRAAYKRLKVYVGVPREFKDTKAETVENAKKPHLIRYVSLGEVSQELGSKRSVSK